MIGTVSVCQSCKHFAEIVKTDTLGLEYCAGCARDLPPTSEDEALLFLIANPPFHSGDRVECRTGGEIYEGTGVVRDMSFDFQHGGTLIYPAFRVEIDSPANEHSPAEGWWTEVCLTRVGEG
jgi:hypothetical protein